MIMAGCSHLELVAVPEQVNELHRIAGLAELHEARGALQQHSLVQACLRATKMHLTVNQKDSSWTEDPEIDTTCDGCQCRSNPERYHRPKTPQQ